MLKQYQTFFLKCILLITSLVIFVLFTEAQVKRMILGDCPLTTNPAGPDKTICPYPGSVQIGTTPENGMTYL